MKIDAHKFMKDLLFAVEQNNDEETIINMMVKKYSDNDDDFIEMVLDNLFDYEGEGYITLKYELTPQGKKILSNGNIRL